jgi:signal transduction histidine kinase
MVSMTTAIGSRIGHRGALPNPVRLLFSSRPWVAAAFMLLSFVIGLFWFVTLMMLISSGLGMAVMVFGLPILLVTMVLWTWGARAERWRVAAFFGTPMPAPYRPLPEGPWYARLRTFVTDPAVWRDLAYLLLLFPIGIAEFIITIVAVTVPVAMVTFPTWYWIHNSAHDGGNRILDTLPEALIVAAVGLPLLLVAMPYVLVGMANAHVLLAKALLTHNREEELEARVGVLTESRSRVMDAALAERRRIERDLHDGAQQRLVALAMDLGMAKIKMESDPEAAKALVEEAHKEAKLAMAEIRNLVRGVYPAVLTDRGLDAAISALAGRSPIPVAVMVDLDEQRLPVAVETTAYFVVAEALTNVAKHSVATEAEVRVCRLDERLIVEVVDNGVGGADAATGTGLAGLAGRVEALDGRLTVSSPRGGPTRVRAEIPCGL